MQEKTLSHGIPLVLRCTVSLWLILFATSLVAQDQAYADGASLKAQSISGAYYINDAIYLGAPEGENPIVNARVTIVGVVSGDAAYSEQTSWNGKGSGLLTLDNLVADQIYIKSAYSSWDEKRLQSFNIEFYGDNKLTSGISMLGQFEKYFGLFGPGNLTIKNAEYGIAVEGAHDVDDPPSLMFQRGKIVIDSPKKNGVAIMNGNIFMVGGSLTVKNAKGDGIVAMPYGLSDYGGTITVGKGFKLSCSVKNPKKNYPFAGNALYRYDLLANPMTAKAKTIKVKAKAVKSRSISYNASKAFVVKKAKGTVTYKKISGNKRVSVTSKGKVTLKKGLKKGIYKVRVEITAAGKDAYKAEVKTVTLVVKVK